MPSALTERICRIPETLLTSSSIMSVISVSIVSGEAPGKVVVTDTYGNSILGKRSTPSLPKLKRPRTTNDAITIVAKTGRRIETLEIHISLGFRCLRSTFCPSRKVDGGFLMILSPLSTPWMTLTRSKSMLLIFTVRRRTTPLS